MSDQPEGLFPYPLGGAALSTLAGQALHRHATFSGASQAQGSAGDHPVIMAQKALLSWNAYLSSGDQQHRAAFLAQAGWFLEHATPRAGDVSGWPVLTQWDALPEPVPLLSATIQGLALSVLIRAYQLTGESAFWHLAQCAVHTFERDIFDGGVRSQAGEVGIFFEERAAYPASHQLSACLVALYGLHEYLAITHDEKVAGLVQSCLATLHNLMAIFDTGYWSRVDVASKKLADPATHAVHIELLKLLAAASGDETWAVLATRWAGYQHALRSRLRYGVTSTSGRAGQQFWGWIQRRFSGGAEDTRMPGLPKVCVPITAFPVAGGMRSVLVGVAQAMASDWEIHYLTWHIGPGHEGLTIQSFGGAYTTYWQFPNVWLYVLAGCRRLLSLLRRGAAYALILPQDGIFTGAFAALAARLAGVHIVGMDHGTIPLPFSKQYRVERLTPFATAPWLVRLLARLRFALYWPSLRLLAHITIRATHLFLLAGEDVEITYRQRLGISSDRIFRFPYPIDTKRYAPRDGPEKAQLRRQFHLPPDSIVVAMVNRLAPEKGLDIALQGISHALKQLPSDLSARMRVVIAGDGPLRSQVEEDIHRYQLESSCLLWGEVSRDDVALLLSISDLFLFTAIRDSNSMAVHEAMAAGLLVIASLVPSSKAVLLAEGRGMAIPAGDVEAVSMALADALRDLPRCREMGKLARTYIEAHHSAEVIRRSLLRATGWPLKVSDVNRAPREAHQSNTAESASFVAEQGIAQEGSR